MGAPGERPQSPAPHRRSEKEPASRLRWSAKTTAPYFSTAATIPGFLVASRAMLLAIAKAKAAGVATAAVRNAYLGGINGYYVSLAARQGLIAIMTTASGGRVAPAGGIDPLFGTNPIAVAIPTLDQPIILDMATASTNVGGLHRAERQLKRDASRPGIAIGPDGAPTVDPSRALEGAILPFGGHKGSGLAMIVQCLGTARRAAPIMPQGHQEFRLFLPGDRPVAVHAGGRIQSSHQPTRSA